MHPDTVIYYLRCGAVTWGQGRAPNDCDTSNHDFGPFFFDWNKALHELHHLQDLQPENSYEIRETTLAAISAEQTEFAGVWKEFFLKEN